MPELDEIELTIVTVEEMSALASAAEFVLANLSPQNKGYSTLASAHEKLLVALADSEGETLQ